MMDEITFDIEDAPLPTANVFSPDILPACKQEVTPETASNNIDLSKWLIDNKSSVNIGCSDITDTVSVQAPDLTGLFSNCQTNAPTTSSQSCSRKKSEDLFDGLVCAGGDNAGMFADTDLNHDPFGGDPFAHDPFTSSTIVPTAEVDLRPSEVPMNGIGTVDNVWKPILASESGLTGTATDPDVTCITTHVEPPVIDIQASPIVTHDPFQMQPFDDGLVIGLDQVCCDMLVVQEEAHKPNPDILSISMKPAIQSPTPVTPCDSVLRDQINGLLQGGRATRQEISPVAVCQRPEVLVGPSNCANEADVIAESSNQAFDDHDDFDFDLPSAKPCQGIVRSMEPSSTLASTQQILNVKSGQQPDLISTAVDAQKPEAQCPDGDVTTGTEWDVIQTIEPDFESSSVPGAAVIVKSVTLEPVSYSETVRHLQKSALYDQYSSKIVRSVQRRGLSALLHRLCGGPRLHHDLHSERDFVFCVAACPFINTDDIHVRVLHMIYRSLTGARVDCPRFGNHWEQIGFQGSDPATDLRGAGFLSLLQLLYFVTEPNSTGLARDVYRLSLSERQNFPFALMGITLTRLAVASLREDCLNKECNRRQNVLAVLNDFYHGCWSNFFTTWRTQNKTIADMGFIIAELESFAKKRPLQILRLAETPMNNAILPSQSTPGEVEPIMDFSNMVDIGDEDSSRKY